MFCDIDIEQATMINIMANMYNISCKRLKGKELWFWTIYSFFCMFGLSQFTCLMFKTFWNIIGRETVSCEQTDKLRSNYQYTRAAYTTANHYLLLDNQQWAVPGMPTWRWTQSYLWAKQHLGASCKIKWLTRNSEARLPFLHSFPLSVSWSQFSGVPAVQISQWSVKQQILQQEWDLEIVRLRL